MLSNADQCLIPGKIGRSKTCRRKTASAVPRENQTKIAQDPAFSIPRGRRWCVCTRGRSASAFSTVAPWAAFSLPCTPALRPSWSSSLSPTRYSANRSDPLTFLRHALLLTRKSMVRSIIVNNCRRKITVDERRALTATYMRKF